MGDRSQKAKDKAKKQDTVVKDQKKADVLAKSNPVSAWKGAEKKGR